MSLLRQIQDAAVDSNSDLGEVLRKCKVLAARLDSKTLEDWLLWESNGYPEDVEVPDYRTWGLELKGTFAGPFGKIVRHALIPARCVPERLRDRLLSYDCRESISSIERLLAGEDKGIVYVATGDLPVILGPKVYQGMNCVEAHGQFASGNLVEVLNTVRNRVLDFALALEKVEPRAGDIPSSSANLEPGQASSIFLKVMGDLRMGDSYSAGQVGAMGPNAHAHDMTFQQVWNQNAGKIDLPQLKQELAQLREAMRQQATDPEHFTALSNVVTAETEAEAGNGAKVMEHLRGAGRWGLEVATAIGVNVAASAIGEALSAAVS